MSNLIITQAAKLGESFGMEGDGHELLQILKSTAFKGQVSDAQMTALLVVANQYGLNPWVKEIYAFPDRQNGIVPVVGVDGWSRIMNEHQQFDGIEFEQDDSKCTCIIYRKDRSRAIKVTEWMDECRRDTGPWKSHGRRMLRHKAMIQCARLAFGFGGIYDQDEAERIVEAQPVKHMGTAEVVQATPQALPEWPADKWAAALPKLLAGIAQGKSVDDALAWLRAKATVTPEQEQELRDKAAAQQQAAAPAADTEQLAQALQSAPDIDALCDVASRLDAITDEAQRMRLNDIFDARVAELEQA